MLSEDQMNTTHDKVDQFEFRPLKAEDVQQVAALHAQVFSDYFLTHMGQSFLELFYSQFVKYPGIAVVAYDGNQCVGFVAGTPLPEQFLRGFYRKSFLPIALITIQRFLLDSLIRKEIRKRIGHIRLAVNEVFKRNKKVSSQLSSQPSPANKPTTSFRARPADLLGIGVHPSWQGKGIADELVHQFGIALSQMGVKTMSLTVRSNNARAIRFYEKTGWRVLSTDVDSIHFYRSTNFS